MEENIQEIKKEFILNRKYKKAFPTFLYWLLPTFLFYPLQLFL